MQVVYTKWHAIQGLVPVYLSRFVFFFHVSQILFGAGRLADIKDLFDRMLIICTCVIITQQLSREQNTSESNQAASSVQMNPLDVIALTERLQSMIEDENLTGQAIASEILRASGSDEKDSEVTRIESLISRMLTRSNASCKALVNGLGKVLSSSSSCILCEVHGHLWTAVHSHTPYLITLLALNLRI